MRLLDEAKFNDEAIASYRGCTNFNLESCMKYGCRMSYGWFLDKANSTEVRPMHAFCRETPDASNAWMNSSNVSRASKSASRL